MNKSEILIKKHRFLREVRDFFDASQFIEVNTPLLVPNPGLEPFLIPFQTEYLPLMGGGEKKTFYLPTSPEYHLKKALALGLPKVFEISKSFRNGEKSREHEPEFLMLEWYRHPGSYLDIANDFFDLCQELSPQFAKDPALWKEKIDLSVAEAFQKFAGLDLIEAVKVENDTRHANHLNAQALRKNLGVEAGASFEDTFNWVLVSLVEPALKNMSGLVYLWDYPATFAALARKKASNPFFAERFEVYFKGLELANAFGELTDPKEQRIRCEEDIKKRLQLYGFSPPIDEEFLQALGQLKNEAGGIAVGLERLFQIMGDHARIQDVIAFPHWEKL